LWKSSLPKTQATEKPNHSACGQGKEQVQKQVSFKFRSFQLPLPCGQAACNSHRGRQRRTDKIIECGLRQRWIPFADREEIKCHTDDEERYRKVNDYRVLRVFRKQSGF
jgi:hypothetical protein